ncbi:hypothetical protein ACQUWX_28155, partial [Ralstonia pseudosolanacearum]
LDSIEMAPATIETGSTTKMHSATMEYLEVTAPLKMEKLKSFLVRVVLMAVRVVHPVGVVVVALIMVKLTESALRGYLNVAVGLDAGVMSNVMVLDVVTGGQLLMKLLRTLRNWAMQMRA